MEKLSREQQARLDRSFANICKTVWNGRVLVDNHANRVAIFGWYDELRDHETNEVEWFLKVLREQPGLADQVTWQDPKNIDPAYQRQQSDAQAIEDRETFTRFTIANGYSLVDANYDIARSLGPGFAGDDLKHIAHRLVRATQAEVQQRHADAVNRRQHFLKHQATDTELQAAAKQESELGRTEAQRSQFEHQLAIREQKDAQYGFPALPDVNQMTGEKIDAAYLIRLSNSDIRSEQFQLSRNFIRKHGSAAVTARILRREKQ